MATRPLRVVKPQRSRKEVREAKEALSEMEDTFLECRDLHHPWEIVGYFYEGTEIHRKLLCRRCGTEATDRWTGRGERIQRKYKYADGYQVHSGKRIMPIDIRREAIKRVEVYADQQELLDSLFSGSRKRKRA